MVSETHLGAQAEPRGGRRKVERAPGGVFFAVGCADRAPRFNKGGGAMPGTRPGHARGPKAREGGSYLLFDQI